MKLFFIKKLSAKGKLGNPLQKIDQKIIKQILGRKCPNSKQLRYLPKFLSQKEKVILVILSIVVIVSFAILCSQFNKIMSRTTVVPAIGGTYVEGVVGFPQYINPVLAQNNEVDLGLTHLIYSGLIKYNNKLELELDLAERYEMDEDNKVYRFYLRSNIFWHDNQPLTSDDIIFTIEKLKEPQFQGLVGQYFQNIAVKKIDEKTIEFTLDKPNPHFLRYLTWGIIPQHIWQNIPSQQMTLTEYNLKPIGSGPFVFKNLTRDKYGLIRSYTLERNKKFYKSVYLQQVIFKFFIDFDELEESLQKREIDGLYYAPKQLADQINNLKFLQVYSLKLPHYTAIFFNQQNNEFLQSRTIRKVLAYVTPKEKILKDVFNQEIEMIDSPILPDAFGYKDDIKKYKYDPEKAIQILENAGWRKDNSGYWQKDNKTLSLTITTSQQPDLESTAKIIQEAWQNIGIKTKVIAFPSDIIKKEVISPRNYQALLFGVVERFDSDHYDLWHSSRAKYPGLNLSLFLNSRVDELLEKTKILPFEEARRKKYFELQDIVAEEVPAIFLYSNNYTYPVSKKVKNIDIEKINLPHDRFNNIENWYIKTKSVKTADQK